MGGAGTSEPTLVLWDTSVTHTQVPGVQLHLLLQLCQELVVEGLELQKEKTQFLGEDWQTLRGAGGDRGCTDRADGRQGQTDTQRGTRQRRSRCPSRPDPFQLSKSASEGLVLPGQDMGNHRVRLGPGTAARPGCGTHHLLQLVLDLPVDFCHLEEHISCKDRPG